MATVSYYPYDLAEDAYRYRAMKIGDKGWDVFSLQTLVPRITADGSFGPITDGAVRAYQERQGLVVDGIAGIVTQRSLCLYHIFPIQASLELPPGLMRGQTEKESGFQVGNHTAPYADGARDLGVVQRNTNYAQPKDGFNAVASIGVLGDRLRKNHDMYEGYGVVKDQRRLWELAAGSWNAPSWTDRLARGGTLTAAQSEHLEAYIDRVTIYMKP